MWESYGADSSSAVGRVKSANIVLFGDKLSNVWGMLKSLQLVDLTGELLRICYSVTQSFSCM
jgi:hypothetical protein